MFVKEKFVGLDIGTSSVKLVELRKSGQKMEVVRVCRAEVEDEQDPVLRQAGMVKTVGDLLKKEKLKGAWAAISISGQSAFVKFLKLPRMAEKKVDQIIRYEAQQQVPFPINEVVWDYHVLSGTAGAEMEVALVAIKTSIIQQLLTVLGKAKLNIELVNTTSLAMYNLFQLYGGHEKATVLLDIGARTTNVIIGCGETVWMRSLPIAGADFSRALSDRLSIDFAGAEKKKREKGIVLLEESSVGEDPEMRMISEAIAPVVSDLSSEILNSITYFNSQYKEIMIERVFLTGGGSGLKNLDRFLEMNLGLPVKDFEYLSAFRVRGSLSESLAKQKSYLGVAFGLALQSQRSVAIGVNLLPEYELKSNVFKKKKESIFFGQILAIMVIAVLVLFTRADIGLENGRLKQIKKYHSEFKELGRRVRAVEEEIKPASTKIELLRVIEERRVFCLEILDELAKVLPGDVWLTSFSLQEGQAAERSMDDDDSYEDSGFFDDDRGMMAGETGRVTEEMVLSRRSVSLSADKERLSLFISGKTTRTLPSINELVESLNGSELFSKIRIISANYADVLEGAYGRGERGEGVYDSRSGARRRPAFSQEGEEKIADFRIQLQVERDTL